jgi:hypothetical protein
MRLIRWGVVDPFIDQADNLPTKRTLYSAVRYSDKFSLRKIVVAQVLCRVVVSDVLQVEMATEDTEIAGVGRSNNCKPGLMIR